MLLAIWFLVLSTSHLYAAEKEPVNYCNDKTSWTQWENLLADNPADKSLRLLYALRIGLCVMVDHKKLTIQEATKILEHQRDALIQQKNQSESRVEFSM